MATEISIFQATSTVLSIVGATFIGYALGTLTSWLALRRDVKRLEEVRTRIEEHERRSSELLLSTLAAEKSAWEFWQKALSVYRQLHGADPVDTAQGSGELH